VDSGGRVWTPVESKARLSGLCGRLWTAVDTAWRSTDQKVGGSSPSGRPTGSLDQQRDDAPRRSEPSAGYGRYGLRSPAIWAWSIDRSTISHTSTMTPSSMRRKKACSTAMLRPVACCSPHGPVCVPCSVARTAAT